MTFTFNAELYSKSALFKSAYHFIDDYYLHLDYRDGSYIVDIEPKDASQPELPEQEFVNEMLIQETRNIVESKTASIREMIYKRSLASTVIDNSVTKESEDLQQNYSESEEEILSDWFEGKSNE